MNHFTLHQSLPPFSIIGYNYAEAHDNKIHSDDIAAQYGFKGGLVPGVGLYAYLTHPVVAALGVDWLRRGTMSARFLKPIYHGEEAIVHTTVIALEPLTLKLELRNATETLCAVGEASLPSMNTAIHAADFPAQPLPLAKPPASLAALPGGTTLGSLHWQLDLATISADKFLHDVRATLPLYFGEQAVCHPAFYLAQANEILMANVQLGPWIHTGSDVQHYDLPRAGEHLSLRGNVADAFAKRGHEIVTLDLGLFGNEERPIAHLRHTAIVRLRAA